MNSFIIFWGVVLAISISVFIVFMIALYEENVQEINFRIFLILVAPVFLAIVSLVMIFKYNEITKLWASIVSGKCKFPEVSQDSWLIFALVILAAFLILGIWLIIKYIKKSSISYVASLKLRKFIVIEIVLSVFLVFFIPKIIMPYFSKASRLERQITVKLNEAKNLQDKLNVKQKEIANLIIDYENSIKILVEEIKEISIKNNISNYQQAVKQNKIKYDLLAIQRKRAYIQKLNDLEVKIGVGINELGFIAMQASDDLKIVKVLNSDEAEILIKEIEKVIDEYLPQTKELVIEVDESKLISPEQIWLEIKNEMNIK